MIALLIICSITFLTQDWSLGFTNFKTKKLLHCAKVVSSNLPGLCEIKTTPVPNFLPSVNNLLIVKSDGDSDFSSPFDGTKLLSQPVLLSNWIQHILCENECSMRRY